MKRSQVIDKRAQAAMEFLMTYGWALLVVIIVIAALAFFGLLNPQRFLPEKCEIAPGITCVDFRAVGNSTGGGNITILLNNGLGRPITVWGINFTASSPVSVNSTFCGYNYSSTDYVTIVEGATQNFSMSGLNIGLACASGLIAGGRFRSDIYFNYSTTIEGTVVSHVKKGYIVVQVDRN